MLREEEDILAPHQTRNDSYCARRPSCVLFIMYLYCVTQEILPWAFRAAWRLKSLIFNKLSSASLYYQSFHIHNASSSLVNPVKLSLIRQ